MEQRRFIIQPIGAVQGGTFQYAFDPDKGVLNYSLHGSIRVVFWTKAIDSSGSQAIDPETLKSQHYSRINAPINFAGLVGKIIHFQGTTVTAQVSFQGMAQGLATFDISGQYVALVSLNATVTYGPFSGQIVALPDGALRMAKK